MDFLQIITPFLLASIGGLYTEHSGTTNVAIEGYITMGAFLFITFSKLTGNIYIGVIFTILIIIVISFLHSLSTIKLKANPIITGLAINMGFFGLISALAVKIFNTKGVIVLDQIDPINTEIITFIALLLPFISIFIINYTRYGLRLRARGSGKKNLIYSNINPNFYRITPVIISATFSALAGIFLSMELRSFVPGISAGRGWISLVIVFLGRKRPIGILIGCGIFTLSQMLSNIGQGRTIPSDIILALPYIITLVALIFSPREK
ncbi:MAG: ABC transporter permease [Spirochaetaceae bacterium]